jgi:hypothetical protein
MAIDNPSEKIRELVEVGDFDGVGAALQVGGILSPIFKVASIAKSIATSHQSGENIRIAIIALCDELERIQDRWPKDLESALDNDWFKRAMTVLMEESARATNQNYARLLARVAAQGCFPPTESKHRQDDLASYIHDLARLGTDDIEMLRILRDSYKDVFRNDPSLRDPNRFTSHNETFKQAADKLNIHPDDRLSLGARLSGFGLAFESVPQMGERFFRPTRRGIYLLSLLEAAELPMEQQN